MGLLGAFEGDQRIRYESGFSFLHLCRTHDLGRNAKGTGSDGRMAGSEKFRALRAYLAAQGETLPSAEDASKVLNMDRAEVVLLLERLEPGEAWLLCQRYILHVLDHGLTPPG